MSAVFGPYRTGRPGETAYADPLAATRALWQSTGGRLDQLLDKAQSADEATCWAVQAALVLAAREAFDLAPFDPATGQGVLDDQALGLLDAFLEWCEKKKAAPASPPTLLQPSAPPP